MTTRHDVAFTSAGITCQAWLYLPPSPEPPPIVVMAHGFGGIRQMRLDAYADRFTRAGYACLVFDYRHFGASDGQPRQLLNINRQLADWAAAIRFARARDDVDGSRIILWGSSFSGGHVITTAARDAGISAVIAQCPFTDGVTSVLAMPRVTALKVGARALIDLTASQLRKGPVLLPVVGPPGSTAVMTAPDALPAMMAMVPNGVQWRNEVAARVALEVLTYRPGRTAARVQCPVLFGICDADTVTPADTTLRYANTAPRAEVRLYPEGHFDIYLGDAFERIVSDQIDFLHRHVPANPTSPAPTQQQETA
jgi:pimeloyl-ACP methyl ester carboxylesterase